MIRKRAPRATTKPARKRRERLSVAKRAADQRALFVARYIELGFQRATQAAIDVGYAPRSAHVTASRLLARPDVRAQVETAQQRVTKAAEKKAILSRDRLARELRLVAHSSVEHYEQAPDGRVILRNGAPRGAMRAVSKVKVRKRTVHTESGSIETVETEYGLWNKLGAIQQARELEGFDAPSPSAKGAMAGAVIEVYGGPMGFEARVAIGAAVRTGTDNR